MVHLSGATAMDKLRPPCAVVWPIRSFNPKADSVPLEGTPTVLEASDAQSMALADLLSQAWKGEVTEVSGDQRAATHLAAAIADNFANHMFAESQDLLRQRGLPTTLLRNLVLGLTQGGLHGDSLRAPNRPCTSWRRGHLGTTSLLLPDDVRELYDAVTAHIVHRHNP